MKTTARVSEWENEEKKIVQLSLSLSYPLSPDHHFIGLTSLTPEGAK